MTQIDMSTAVIIARFQTPYLHQGHKQLIKEVYSQHNKLIVILGVSPITGRKNPFDFYIRERMIKRAYNETIVLPLSDHPSDIAWSKNLDNLLRTTFPTEQFTLYGSRDSFIPYYTGAFPTIELEEHGDYNATELRAKYADKVFDSKDFRAGILYGLNTQYKKVYPTVDVAVFRNDKTEILLARKAVSKRWQLIGGFCDPEDSDYEEAAKRELIEECGQIEVSAMHYETSARIDDWRYRPEIDKIITTLFSCDLLYGEPVAHDDIEEVEWFKTEDLNQMHDNGMLSEEHNPLFERLINTYTRNLKTLAI